MVVYGFVASKQPNTFWLKIYKTSLKKVKQKEILKKIYKKIGVEKQIKFTMIIEKRVLIYLKNLINQAIKFTLLKLKSRSIGEI